VPALIVFIDSIIFVLFVVVDEKGLDGVDVTLLIGTSPAFFSMLGGVAVGGAV
jgi:hypothetical protein